MHLRVCLYHERHGMLSLIYLIENGMLQARKQVKHSQVHMRTCICLSSEAFGIHTVVDRISFHLQVLEVRTVCAHCWPWRASVSMYINLSKHLHSHQYVFNHVCKCWWSLRQKQQGCLNLLRSA